MTPRIRILVVDDSLTVRKHLVELLARTSDFEVVGETSDGQIAIDMCTALKPDVVSLDLELPTKNGLAVTEHIMAYQPTPILIVSASFNRGAVLATYDALAAGAVDVLDKSAASDPDWDQTYLSAVRMVSRIKVITHPRTRLGPIGQPRTITKRGISSAGPQTRPDVVAIGASTGGPSAISHVLRGIPRAEVAVPILVVMHIDAAFAPSFALWLGTQTGHDVELAVDGVPLAAAVGKVLVAPPSMHLTVASRRIKLVADAPRNYCRPSVDVLFESLAREYGPAVAACILTGMGKDGAAGMVAMRNAGGQTIAQDEASSVVWGMPREAVALGGASRVLALADIGPALRAMIGRRG